MYSHALLSGAAIGPEGKGSFGQPQRQTMGAGLHQPPPQFFAALQPGYPSHPGHPIGQGVPQAVPHGHLTGFERKPGVFDMASIEEHLMKQSQVVRPLLGLQCSSTLNDTYSFA